MESTLYTQRIQINVLPANPNLKMLVKYRVGINRILGIEETIYFFMLE